MRNFLDVNRYLDILLADIYPQPPDQGHISMAGQVIYKWCRDLACNNVLDVGCGQGIAYPFFAELGIDYTGVTLGDDYKVCKDLGLNVYKQDFTFLSFGNESFDMIFSRHSLEHSVMPLISLMEWERVSRNFLCLILPNPDWYKWAGLNHYSVMHPNQVEFLLDRAGWHIIWSDFDEPQELRYMCEKKHKSHYDKYLETHKIADEVLGV